MTEGLLLFARARRTWPAIGALCLFSIAGLIVGGRIVPLPDETLVLPWDVLLPLLSACVISMTTRSPMNDLEATAAHRLWLLRVSHLSVLAVVAGLGTLLACYDLPAPYSWPSALRNLAMLTGLGLIGARLLGGRLSWIPPITMSLITLTAGSKAGELRIWAVLFFPDHHLAGIAFGALVFAVGVLLLAKGGTREPAGEAG